jgi:hypothetical protein
MCGFKERYLKTKLNILMAFRLYVRWYISYAPVHIRCVKWVCNWVSLPTAASPNITFWMDFSPIAVTTRSKAWVCGSLLAGISGSNLAGGMDDCRKCLCCPVEVSAWGWSFVQRGPTEGNVCDCDLKTSRIKRSWTAGGCRTIEK